MNFFFRVIFILILWGMLIWSDTDALDGNVKCPDNAAALTPAPLEEEWAVEWWMPRHEEKLNEEGRESSELLFLGDSITHGWESTGENVFEQYFSGYKVHNLGFSGDRTENVLWRIQNGALNNLNPKVAVLMIGTNNTGHRQDSAECTAKGIELILDEFKERLPETRVLLLAIFPRGEAPDEDLRQLNKQINQRIEKFSDREKVTFLDINHVFLSEEGFLSEEIMPDMLHPNEHGYQIWAESIDSYLKKLFEN